MARLRGARARVRERKLRDVPGAHGAPIAPARMQAVGRIACRPNAPLAQIQRVEREIGAAPAFRAAGPLRA